MQTSSLIINSKFEFGILRELAVLGLLVELLFEIKFHLMYVLSHAFHGLDNCFLNGTKLVPTLSACTSSTSDCSRLLV